MMNGIGFRPQVAAAPTFQAASFIRQTVNTPVDQVLQTIEASAVSRLPESRKGILEGANDLMTLESPFNPVPYFVQGYKRGCEPKTVLGTVLGEFVEAAGSALTMDVLYPVVKKCVQHIAKNDPDANIKAQAQEMLMLFAFR